jgi:hypothetical protein
MSIRASLFVCTLLVAAAAGTALSQTTIFNIPTADTLQKGSVNLEADFLAKPAKYRKGGYQTFGYRVAYGTTNETEIGSNFYFTWDGTSTVADVEFSLKRRFYQNERLGLTVAGGAVAFVPLRDRIGDKTSLMLYGNAAKSIKSLNGATVTGGVYHVFGGTKDFGTRTGLMFGLIQPVKGRFSFVGDWFTGNNRLGYASAGVNIAVTKRQYFLAGYSFGNSGRGNNMLAAYYGITF